LEGVGIWLHVNNLRLGSPAGRKAFGARNFGLAIQRATDS
jgi:hypothetical protein